MARPAARRRSGLSTDGKPRDRQPSPASCRACPRGQRGVAGGTSPHAGGARPRGRRSSPTQPARRGPQRFPACWQSAPSLAATGISRCSYLWSRLAQFIATELDSTMRDFNSIAADVDLSMKSWLGRLRSGGPCHRCAIHNQQAILPLLPAAATLRQSHRRRRHRYSQVLVRGVRRPAPALLRAEEAGAGRAEPKLRGHVGRAGSQRRRRAPPAANQLLSEALRHIGWSTMNVRAWACLDAAGEHA